MNVQYFNINLVSSLCYLYFNIYRWRTQSYTCNRYYSGTNMDSGHHMCNTSQYWHLCTPFHREKQGTYNQINLTIFLQLLLIFTIRNRPYFFFIKHHLFSHWRHNSFITDLSIAICLHRIVTIDINTDCSEQNGNHCQTSFISLLMIYHNTTSHVTL